MREDIINGYPALTIFDRSKWPAKIISNDQMLIVSKCLDENTKIITNKGIKTAKEILSTDLILSYNKEKNISEFKNQKKIYQGRQECYKATLSNGEEVICTKEHIFFIKNKFGEIKEIPLSELKEGDKILTFKRRLWTTDEIIILEKFSRNYENHEIVNELAKKGYIRSLKSVFWQLFIRKINKNRYELRKRGLWKRPPKANDELIKSLYLEKKMSTNQIGKELNISAATARKSLLRTNTPRRKLKDYPGYWKGRENPALSNRNKLDNPMKDKENKEKAVKNWKQYMKSHPEKLANHILAKRSRENRTKIEKIMTELLEQLKLKENHDFYFNPYLNTKKTFRFPDFLIPSKKLIIETDGKYWHQHDEEERNKEFTDLGYKVVHYTDEQIKNNIEKIKEEIKCLLQ